MVWTISPRFGADLLETLLETFILANLVLGLFNLLPIPPLDGGRIVVGVLPQRWAAGWARLERAGLVIVVSARVPRPPPAGRNSACISTRSARPWARCCRAPSTW